MGNRSVPGYPVLNRRRYYRESPVVYLRASARFLGTDFRTTEAPSAPVSQAKTVHNPRPDSDNFANRAYTARTEIALAMCRGPTAHRPHRGAVDGPPPGIPPGTPGRNGARPVGHLPSRAVPARPLPRAVLTVPPRIPCPGPALGPPHSGPLCHSGDRPAAALPAPRARGYRLRGHPRVQH